MASTSRMCPGTPKVSLAAVFDPRSNPSWKGKELSVDVRGRSQTLRINYRSSHQIRARRPSPGQMEGWTALN